MQPSAYLIVTIDSDPDPVETPRDDEVVLRKYYDMKALIDEMCASKAGVCVHTSPMWRDRFFEEQYAVFWNDWERAGGEFILHVEEDLYAQPVEGVYGAKGNFFNTARVGEVIADAISKFNELGHSFTAYRSGDNNQSLGIVDILLREGIGIDLSCAPDVVDPRAPIQWFGAPLSAYRMSKHACWLKDDAGDTSCILEIPLGYVRNEPSDRVQPDFTRNHLVDCVARERLMSIWDEAVRRSERQGSAQVVQLLCHTFCLHEENMRETLARFFDHVRGRDGAIVSLAEAAEIHKRL